MTEVNDKRIGRIDPTTGKITWPSLYADGVTGFYHKLMPEVTRLKIGKAGHFVIIPPGRAGITPEARAEFEALVGAELSPAPAVPVPPVTEELPAKPASGKRSGQTSEDNP